MEVQELELNIFPKIDLGRIRYYGHPSGVGKKVITEAIEFLKNERDLDGDVKRSIERIREIKAVEFTIFIAPLCAHCAKTVRTLLQFAVVNPGIEVNVIDTTQFEELQERLEIVSVPVILVNRKIKITGETKLKELIELAERVDDEEFIYKFIVRMIREGRARELCYTILNIEMDRILPALLREGDFFIRLGVMYLLEIVSEKNDEIARSLCPKIVELIGDGDERVKEDAIMALGKIGGEEELKILEGLLMVENDKFREAITEAIEEIRERIVLVSNRVKVIKR